MQSHWPLPRLAILIFVFILAALVPSGLLLANDAPVPPGQEPSPPFELAQVPAPATPPNAHAGRGLFVQNCAPCHGETGQGDGPTAANLPSPPRAFADADAVWERSPAELFFTAKFGRMEKLRPPWEDRLSDSQIWNAVAYAWDLHTDQASVEAGGQLYAGACASCHGETGAGDGPKGADVITDFTDARYAMAISQAGWLAGWQTAHPDVGANFSDQQKRNVLEYVRTFSYKPVWEAAYHPGDGVLTGRVVQGTAGGESIDGLQVILEGFVDFAPVATFTTTVGTDGSFSFADLGTDPSIAYFASSSLQGVSYSSPILMFSDGKTSLETTVNVYEPSDDDSGIRVEQTHWIIDNQPGALVVGQIYTYSNSKDRAFVGKQVEGVDVPVTVALAVPPDATGITFENGALGDRFRQVGHTLYDTAPVVPGKGTRQIVVRFALPFDGTATKFEQLITYPTQSLNLLVAQLPGMEVDVNGLTSIGPQDIQGTTYQMWQGQDVSPGQKVTARLSGLLATGDTDPRVSQDGSASQNPLPSTRVPQLAGWARWALGGLMFLALAGVFGWAWQNRMAQPGDEKTLMHRRRQELIQQIAQLDDLHAVGEIQDDKWQQQRARLKAELLTVASKLAE